MLGFFEIRKENSMKWYVVIKPIKDIPLYKVGDHIPLYRGNKGQLLYHVWTFIREVPEDCVRPK